MLSESCDQKRGPEGTLDRAVSARWDFCAGQRALLVLFVESRDIVLRNEVVSGFIFHKKKSKPPRHTLMMATIKEVYDMATESDNTVVDSSEETDKMLVSDDNKFALVPKESFNLFLLAPTTSMFGGKSNHSNEKEGYEPETKKSRRKRKGETGGTNKDKRDKREGKQTVAVKEGPKKDSSGNKIFSDFWANTPELSKKAAIAQINTGNSPELNLYDAISDILAKYKIEGNPATEIKDLVQVSVGQICALRSSVHNMEDRMTKMEERLNAQNPAPTFATVARSFSTSSVPITKQTVKLPDKIGQNSNTKEQSNIAETSIPAAKQTVSDRVQAKAVKPSAIANKLGSVRNQFCPLS
ncbi:hypothetical protein AVEN_266734-1 [Araneus ventricosus]|uniref:Uncharacterized protein n=1 Tax=Araneus ventricosus TaxID=182803 RepID=A0A4Y2S253_ARAVE|nr:hypothetical protein AVEN_266734-1 [Araneus ventricosus]